ncbi:hypothetical protein E3N88_15408 [Mikania micrantha]|uniref:argininosuccinate synthase n=1 Tax=Mikania micrantha TaxID=192012 RepID=A0A5N6NWS3_9ASTR|nr:hypothetical protein E3N88_15408 [Mikania micrantha]
MAHLQVTTSSSKPLIPPLNSECKLGAKASEFRGVAFAHHSTRNLSQTCKSQEIQAVLASDKETDASNATKGRGLRGKLNKVVLAYSGGLDTSVIVPWLRENYGCEVVCFTADVGQGISELEGLEAKAKASGACQLVVKDLTEEFVKDYVFPCLRAGAVYERKYLLGTSMARPVIAKAMVDVAKDVGADAVAHGCTGKGNDQVRFELTFFSLNPDLQVVAPWREWDITGREDAIEYAKKHNVPVPVTKKSIYSRDRNLWHLSHEGDILEDPANEPKKDMYMMSVDPEDAPDKPEYLEIGIVSGIPVSINGKELSPASLLAELNDIGGRHVTLKLYKGSVIVASRKSPYSLYREDISSFESGQIYDQADAAGFIRLYGLPMRVRAMLEKKGRSAINCMPVLEVKGTDEIESLGGECVICLDEKKIGDVVKEMSCKHKFHGGCVDRWQLIYGSCSVCRHKMPADDLGKKIGDEIRRSRR